MLLSFIITNYKTPELLKICLKSLSQASQGIEYELIIVDAESEEETQEIVKEIFPEAIFVPFKENVGYAKLVNRGIELAKGKYLFILNSDIVFLKNNGLEKAIDFMEKNLNVGILGPQLLNFNETLQNSCFRFYTPLIILCRRTFLGRLNWGKKILDNFLMKDYDYQSIKEVDWLMGSALLVRRSALDKVGLMDERFFMYFEDVDWCRRFWQNKYKVVYFPEMKLNHYHQRLSKQKKGILDLFFNKYTRIHIISALKYFLKYGLHK